MKSLTFWSSDINDESLINEVMEGLKTATCTPMIWYYNNPEEEATEVGDYVAVLNNDRIHRCTIQITENYEIPYGMIDIRVAKGENYRSLEEFIEDHNKCWENDLLNEGITLSENTIIVVEHFKLIEVL
ncbi:MAG: ASCH domain-containing protein [Candidatus Pristimantibacillus lignocellulolyticus]|uniref:ASCH domain-containing protein n=1 Tax=Candidatus Pristimantibacillus lignocellulolyticus TaxID=2994561 RepID=A0A9J6ZBJ1_9BACL|nr:MAG: ASCH domain-containing protein [Candidatus Pristimantibacillus lignocellulolyticus]